MTVGASSKLNAEWAFLNMLREEGRSSADQFLQTHEKASAICKAAQPIRERHLHRSRFIGAHSLQCLAATDEKQQHVDGDHENRAPHQRTNLRQAGISRITGNP